jgi:hypothetical protein
LHRRRFASSRRMLSSSFDLVFSKGRATLPFSPAVAGKELQRSARLQRWR